MDLAELAFGKLVSMLVTDADFDGGERSADAFGIDKPLFGRIERAEGRSLGEAVADAERLAKRGENFTHLLLEIGGDGGTATSDHAERAEIVRVNLGRLNETAEQRRRITPRGDSMFFDEAGDLCGLEATARKDGVRTACEDREDAGVKAGDVEEGARDEHRIWRRFVSRRVKSRDARAVEKTEHERRGDVEVAVNDTFRAPARSARKENEGVIVFVDVGFGELCGLDV